MPDFHTYFIRIMEEDDKPFICSFAGCTMRFTNEDHLTVHKKKHDMVLNFDNGVKTNAFVADQTPTPTRFIRNCEEVGLFQDLQNVNPFEETFRKAVEAAKAGAGPLHEVDSLSVHMATDDSLHTPHVFPHIIEDSTSNSSITFKAVTTPVISSTSVIIDGSGKKSSLNNDDSTVPSERQELDQLLHPTSTTGDDNCTTEIVTTSILEESKVVINGSNGKMVGIGNTNKVVRQEADTSQHRSAAHGKTRQIISSRLGNKEDNSVNPESTSVVSPGSSTVQLLLRMPDGKLLQLQTMPVEQFSSSGGNIVTPLPQVESQLQSSQSTAMVLTTYPLPSVSDAEPVVNKTIASSSVVPVKHSSGLSLAKMKLKQTLTSTTRTSAQTSDTSVKIAITKALRAEMKKEAQISKPVNNAIGKQTTSSSNIEDPGEKREKFLARNRVAAMRCREKRKTWIKELERRAEDMQRTNHHLQTEVAALRSEVASLKTLLLAHKDCPVTQAMAQGSTVPVTVPEAMQPPTQIFSVTLPITTNSHATSVQPSAISQNLILVNGTPGLKRGSSEPVLSPAKKILSVNTGSPIIRQALLLPTTQTNIRVINSTPLKAVASAKNSSSLPSANVNIAPAPTVQPGVLVANPIITIPVSLPSNPLSLSAVIQNSNYPQTITPVLAEISGQSAVNNSIVVEKETGCEMNSHVIKPNPNVIHKSIEEKSNHKIQSDEDSDVEIIDTHKIKR